MVVRGSGFKNVLVCFWFKDTGTFLYSTLNVATVFYTSVFKRISFATFLLYAKPNSKEETDGFLVLSSCSLVTPHMIVITEWKRKYVSYRTARSLPLIRKDSLIFRCK